MITYTKLVQQSYLAQIIERQEEAHRKWVSSGYHDFTAHDEYLMWREKAMKIKTLIRNAK